MKIDTDTQRVFIHPDGRMDRKNAARYLGCSPKTLADWAMRAQGPEYVLLGGRAKVDQHNCQVLVNLQVAEGLDLKLSC